MFGDAVWYQQGLRISRLFNPHNPVMIMTQSELLSNTHLTAPSEVALLANLTELMVNLRFSGECVKCQHRACWREAVHAAEHLSFLKAFTWIAKCVPQAGLPGVDGDKTTLILTLC